MSRTYKDRPRHEQPRNRGRGRQRHISVRSVRRDPLDVRKLSRAVVALAMAQADAEARATADDQPAVTSKPPQSPEESQGGR